MSSSVVNRIRLVALLIVACVSANSFAQSSKPLLDSIPEADSVEELPTPIVTPAPVTDSTSEPAPLSIEDILNPPANRRYKNSGTNQTRANRNEFGKHLSEIEREQALRMKRIQSRLDHLKRLSKERKAASKKPPSPLIVPTEPAPTPAVLELPTKADEPKQKDSANVKSGVKSGVKGDDKSGDEGDEKAEDAADAAIENAIDEDVTTRIVSIEEGGKNEDVANQIPIHLTSMVDSLSLANNLFAQGKVDVATPIYEKLIRLPQKASDLTWIQYQLASCYRMQGNLKEAMKLYRTVASTKDDEYWSGRAHWWLDYLGRSEKLVERRQQIQERLDSLRKEVNDITNE